MACVEQFKISQQKELETIFLITSYYQSKSIFNTNNWFDKRHLIMKKRQTGYKIEKLICNGLVTN